MANALVSAISQIAEEKGLSKEIVLETVEAALAAAYRKDFGKPDQIIRVHLDPDNDGMKVERVYKVVADDELKELEAEMTAEQAKLFIKNPKVEDEVVIELPSQSEFGRIAAQTAKQVIIQRIREAERELLYEEFKQKEHMLLNGSVQQIEGENVIVNLGKINGIMFPIEQIRGEHYHVGQRIKVFVKEVIESMRGPQVSVSRADAAIVAELFSLEVPEIAAGSVEIKSISREAGARSKVAVAAIQEGLDPVGSCVGQRGIRVQAVLAELGEEKIDIILWDEDPIKFITNTLSPAKVVDVKLNHKDHTAAVIVPEDQLSLAIGKNGQNVRLASKLSGWNLDIIKDGDAIPENFIEREVVTKTVAATKTPTTKVTKAKVKAAKKPSIKKTPKNKDNEEE